MFWFAVPPILLFVIVSHIFLRIRVLNELAVLFLCGATFLFAASVVVHESAQALDSASFLETPFFSYDSSIWSALRSCFFVYLVPGIKLPPNRRIYAQVPLLFVG